MDAAPRPLGRAAVFISQALKRHNMAHMEAQIEYFDKLDLREVLGDEFDSECHTEGFYSRLSAPGYLDCTDWLGPFKTEKQAKRELCDTYGLCPYCLDDVGAEPSTLGCHKHHAK